MRRTRIIDKTIPGGYTADNVADFLHSLSEDCRTILCVVNTKKRLLRCLRVQSIYLKMKK